jgi:alpha/beta superfamily hydrolase
VVSEAVSFETDDGLTIEGLLHLPEATPAAGIVVCHPHPQYGGEMHNNVVDAISKAALDQGIAALRFNFRGVGDSQGEYDSGIGEQKDVTAALAYLGARAEIDASRLGLTGYSFGSAVAMRAADHGIKALLAVSVPTVAFEVEAPADSCPVLFVSGDQDEYSDPAELHRIAAELGERTSVVIMPGVDHFWWESDERLVATAGEFLAKHLE